MGERSEPTGALQGMRVLECCETTRGAYSGKLLSDLGAEVIRIENRPGAVDDPGPSGRWVYLNTGKRIVEGDWDASEGLIAGLCRQADILIDDLGPERSSRLLPSPPAHLIWCAISPFGATGPYASFKGHHLNLFHAGGEGRLLRSGDGSESSPERPPTQIGSDAGDFDTGANAAIAILAAYYGWLGSGKGVRVDVSAQESQLTLNRTRLSRYNHDGVELRGEARPGRMFRCQDGWVQILGSRDEYWLNFAKLPGAEPFGDPRFSTAQKRDQHAAELRALLSDWCKARRKEQVVSALAQSGFAVGAYSTAGDVLSAPQLAHREFFQTIDVPDRGPVVLPGVPYRLSATPVRLRAPMRLSGKAAFASRRTAPVTRDSPAEQPLSGIRILDFTWAAAGPYATMLLALLGAEVIKVESARRADVARRGFLADYGGVNSSPNFNELNLNKRSLQVDLTNPSGLELVHKLLPLCDVVVDNFRPGVMERFGLAPKTLLERFPGVVVASSSANGSTGPEAQTAGLASIFSAKGGLSEQTGYADGPPTDVGESTDYRSGNALALALLAALIHRNRTGEGQAIDLSSTEAVVAVSPDAVLAQLSGATPSGRLGNRHPIHAPHGLYPAAGEDEWISIAVTCDEEWRGLCRSLGNPAQMAGYVSAQERKANEEELDAVIASWTRNCDAQELFLLLQQHGVPTARCLTNRQLAQDAHLAARGVFVDVEHPVIGRHRVMRAPWLFSDPRMCVIRRHGPLMGQDNDYILRDLLRAPDDARAQLEEALQ